MNKISAIFVILTIALAAFIGYTKYVQYNEREKITQEIVIETLEQGSNIRKNVDQALQEVYRINPDRTGELALEMLRERQSND